MQPFRIDTGVFGLKGFHEKGAGEGDGFAWIDRYTISGNHNEAVADTLA